MTLWRRLKEAGYDFSIDGRFMEISDDSLNQEVKVIKKTSCMWRENGDWLSQKQGHFRPSASCERDHPCSLSHCCITLLDGSYQQEEIQCSRTQFIVAH